MTDNYSPADLIYLYLDGEADSGQQTTMFAALASDPELQQEFSEALSMRRAFEHERSSAKPPMYLTNRVLQDAGILPKALGMGALGSGLWLWLRKAAIPVGSLLLGSAVTFFAMSWLSTNNASQASQQNSTIASGQTSSSTSNATANGALHSSTESVSDINLRASTAPLNHVSNVGYVREGRSLPSAVPTEGRRAAASRMIDNPSTRVAAPDAQTQQLAENNASEEQGNDGFLEQQVDVSHAAAYNNVSNSRRLAMVNVPVTPFNTGKTSDFSINFNRLAAASVLGAIPGSSNPGLMADPSLSVYYNMNENAALGMGFSSSRFNVSDNTKSGVALQNPRLTVWTVEYQRITSEDLLFGAPGYLNIALGGTWNSGAIMGLSGASFGLRFPVSVIHINTGLSFEGMWYQSQSGLKPNGKISAVFGLGYNW